ncbi:MAG: hypothetical protein AAB014_02815, partial [Nitrospirota bacterium]
MTTFRSFTPHHFLDTNRLACRYLPGEQGEQKGEAAMQAPLMFTQRAKRALRGRLQPALPVEGATQAPLIDWFDKPHITILSLIYDL